MYIFFRVFLCFLDFLVSFLKVERRLGGSLSFLVFFVSF